MHAAEFPEARQPASQPSNAGAAHRAAPGRKPLQLLLVQGLAWALPLLGGLTPAALAQNFEERSENPVFVDEPPAVTEGLSQIQTFITSGNLEQAAWLIHRLLEQSPGAVVKSVDDDRLHLPLRQRLLTLLSRSPQLLTAYRDRTEALAKAKLDAGDSLALIRTYPATQVGLEHLVTSARQSALAGYFYTALQQLDDVASFPLTDAQLQSRRETLQLIAAHAAAAGSESAAQNAGAQLEKLGVPIPAAIARAQQPQQPLTLLTPSPTPIGPSTLSKPLATVPFIEPFVPIQPPRFGGMLNQLELIPPYLREGRFWPIVTSSSVVVMQDEKISAFDRISLRQLWSIDPLRAIIGLSEPVNDGTLIDRTTGLRGVNPLHWEEVKQAASIEPLIFAIAGRDIEGFRDNEGDELLIAIDIASGEPRWYRSVQGLDETLATAVVRGPLVAHEGLLHLALARRQPERRQSGALQAAVDPWTGKLIWSTSVGSSGALPFARSTQISDTLVAAEGVIYRSDRMGVIGAYRAGDGLPLWVRTAPAPIQMDLNQPTMPYTVFAPVKIGPAVFVFDGSKQNILKLDAATGALLATRSTMDLRQPLYLLACGGELVAVDEQTLTVVPADETFATAKIRGTGRLGETSSGIRGRVTVAGQGDEQRLVVPIASGLAILDPRELSTITLLKLDGPGSAISTDQGLLTIDDGRVHIYSTWDVASKHLRKQSEADASDPGPAAELLALADRAGEISEILPAALRSVTALEADATGRYELVRQRVVRSLLAIVQRSLVPSSPSATQANEGVKLPVPQLGELIALAQRISRTPSQRASTLLLKADLLRSQSDFTGAMENWHQVQLDRELAAVAFDGRSGATTAGDEARQNMQAQLVASGRSVHAALDRQFDEAVARLAAEPSSPEVIERLTQLAESYRLAQRGPELYLKLASMQQAGPGSLDEARYLERGIQHAERLGSEIDPQIVGELNGRLIKRLIDRKLFTAAADALRRSQRTFAGVPLRVDGQVLDLASIQASLASELTLIRRWPRVGLPGADLSSKQVQMLEGWALLSPLMLSPQPTTHQFAVLQRGDDDSSRVAVFAAPAGALAGQAAESTIPRLAPIWQSKDGPDTWTLLRQDTQSALFIAGSSQGARLVRVDLSSALSQAGQEAAMASAKVWESQPFPLLFPQDPPLLFGDDRIGPRVRFLLEGDRPASELIAATDGRTISLIERTGRIASFDLATGQLLFTQRLPISNIVDADMTAGRLIIAGKVAGQGGALSPNTQAIALVDARSGQLAHLHRTPTDEATWLRVTSRGDVIVGGRRSICNINPESGQQLWTVADHASAASLDAWLIDDRLFVINDDRQLWEISALTGAITPTAIDTSSRLDARLPIDLVGSDAPGGPATLLTSRGVCMIGTGGQVIGGDGLQLRDVMELSVQPACVDQGVLMIGIDPARAASIQSESMAPYKLWLLEATTGKLRGSIPVTIGAIPTRMRILDGHILLSGAASTIVIPASPK
jgi:outer membrane protein assembly factor BamB